MVYGYIRVSTDKQTVENQRFEIERFCKKEGLTIDGWIEETISGTKNYNKRALGKLLNRIVKDDLIICTELSRLGRNLFMIMEILNICMTKESRVWTILKSATKLFSVLLASKRPLITELADKLRLKYPLLPTISPCPTMRLEAIRSIIPISCRRYPKSV